MQTLKAQKTFTFEDRLVAGVAYDGSKVWASIWSGGKGSTDGKSFLARIDRETGQIEYSVETPKITGLAWDGSHLWGASMAGILRIDSTTLAVVKTLPRPPVEGFITGLAWDGEALWLGVYREKKILKIDPETGAVLREVASDRFVTGVTWVDGALWHVADDEENPPRPAEMRRLNAHTGAVLTGIELPFSVSGLDHDGEVFWCGDSRGHLRAVGSNDKS